MFLGYLINLLVKMWLFCTKKQIIMEFSLNNHEGNYQRVEKYNNEVTQELSELYTKVLELLGENPHREGLEKTPVRVAKAMQFLLQGYQMNPEDILRSAMFNEDYRQMVVVKDIELFSMCEHHMLPFFGKAHVAYIPNGRITGLSKVARVVEAFSRRLQVQERLTTQIKECIQSTLEPLGVAVVIEAQHLCMQMRGVQKQHSVTTTSDFTGAFNRVATREEFFKIIGSNLH
jgi:GTP cyclohydrolase I